MSIPEPPDGTIVAWDVPARVAKIRMDSWATDEAPLRRWFPLNEAEAAHVEQMTWEAALDAFGREPYRLKPGPIWGEEWT